MAETPADNPTLSFPAFVLSLAHHRAVDTVRREERLRRRTQNPVDLPPTQSEDVADEVVEGTWLAQRRVEVREALGVLSEDQKEVIDLAYFGGLTQAQIAEKLGITVESHPAPIYQEARVKEFIARAKAAPPERASVFLSELRSRPQAVQDRLPARRSHAGT